MNLASNTALLLYPAIECRRHPVEAWVADSPLYIGNGLTCISLVPTPIELLGREPKLDDQIA